ncbi:hypothetical protein PSCICO_24680 [Pseudomonas cichorii]|uniref:Uncharacterized protein n=1 Tax=Pseudomonas serbiensis TaxID=3064350 RepID=A0ABT9CYZ0_9PSED|nr:MULTISPECIES: hypothetical protein [Pseudomonas]MDO7929135.1 hypothetical protein [Pseudomonas sp. KFB-138]GFM77145.1 hypothetical protein PSCICM_29640 [Pseudomonas cichorii]GFM87069.1 hypothetical protein PSCICO_24680 [Pseudomonas cichorii]
MKNKKPQLLSRKPRRLRSSTLSARQVMTRQQVVSAMYAYLMNSWEELPEQNKRALGFDFVVGGEGEEEALNHLARLFMEYAEISFRRALSARRRRLGIID